MVLGLGRLRLRPRDFWALSLCEWRALVEGHFGRAAPPMTRGDLDALMKAYPDGE
ncbi:MAG: phage tail assembly chaperone [Alphaproteobacteria bacterium]|nr:phage tail assembly chaperone [Alphaproteobacteria bacterium]